MVGRSTMPTAREQNGLDADAELDLIVNFVSSKSN
jgi:hypothetical protein